MAEGLSLEGMPLLLEDSEEERLEQAEQQRVQEQPLVQQPGVQQGVQEQPLVQQPGVQQEDVDQSENAEDQGEFGLFDNGMHLAVGRHLSAAVDGGVTDVPGKENDESNKLGTKRKTKKNKENEGVEIEPMPFSDEKLLSQRVFGHCCGQRKESSGNAMKIIKFFMIK